MLQLASRMDTYFQLFLSAPLDQQNGETTVAGALGGHKLLGSTLEEAIHQRDAEFLWVAIVPRFLGSMGAGHVRRLRQALPHPLLRFLLHRLLLDHLRHCL